MQWSSTVAAVPYIYILSRKISWDSFEKNLFARRFCRKKNTRTKRDTLSNFRWPSCHKSPVQGNNRQLGMAYVIGFHHQRPVARRWLVSLLAVEAHIYHRLRISRCSLCQLDNGYLQRFITCSVFFYTVFHGIFVVSLNFSSSVIYPSLQTPCAVSNDLGSFPGRCKPGPRLLSSITSSFFVRSLDLLFCERFLWGKSLVAFSTSTLCLDEVFSARLKWWSAFRCRHFFWTSAFTCNFFD